MSRLQQVVVNKMLSLTTSLLVESDNAQLLHTLLVLERERCAIWTISIFH